MPKSIAELEQNINNSIFFSISGENVESLRNTAKTKLVFDLLEYGKFYWSIAKHGDAVHDAILYCMEKFSNEKGIFTDFFKNRVKFEIINSIKTEKKDNYFYADPVLGVDDDGIEFTFFDTKEFAQNNVEQKIEKDISCQEMAAYFEIIERSFLELQDRVKPMLRAYWTLRSFDALISINLPDYRRYTWIDYDFLEKYRCAEKTPTQKEVAASFNRSEQDASRAINKFIERISPLIKMKNAK